MGLAGLPTFDRHYAPHDAGIRREAQHDWNP